MKIRNRLLLNFGVLLGLMILGFFISVFANYRESQARIALDNTYDVALVTENIRHQIVENHLALNNYLLTGTPSELASLQQGNRHIAELVADAQSKTTDARLRTALNNVGTMQEKWYSDTATRFIGLRSQVQLGGIKPMDLIDSYTETGPSEQLAHANQLIDEVQTAGRALIDKTRETDAVFSNFSTIIDLVGLLLVIAVGFYVAHRTANSITRPLDKIIDAAREIGERGNLDREIDVRGSDEIGRLGDSLRNMVVYFREMASVSETIAGGDLSVEIKPRSEHDALSNAFVKMTAGLRSMVRSVRDASAQVAAGSNQVADASEDSAKGNMQSAAAIDEVTSTMHEMSINVQNMVKNTQMQGSSVSETSASIDEMVASIQRVADTAKVLLDISNRSRDEVTSGIGTMQKTTNGLNRINSAIGSSAAIIATLGERADNIGKIVEVIDDISEQTNLLALNAAIEAARAGEHGLGFAVVADEVRKLAEKSASSTKEISELIGSIQQEARRAVNEMESSTAIVNEGLQLGDDLSEALHKISTVVSEVYNFAQEIGAATNEQSSGSTQIGKATARLNENTHEISSAVEEQSAGAQAVARAMERMRETVQQSSSSATQLAASAEQMSKMARSLLESMDRFVLDNHHEDTPKQANAQFAAAGSQR
jgi:methyl-accepting chemotaxis protein